MFTNTTLTNRLANLLNITNIEKRNAAYTAIAIYIINNSDDVKNYMSDQDNNKYAVMKRNFITNFIYELNEVAVIDMVLLGSIINSWINAKLSFLTMKTEYFVKVESTFNDVLSLTEYNNKYKEDTYKNYIVFQNVYRLLSDLSPIKNEKLKSDVNKDSEEINKG